MRVAFLRNAPTERSFMMSIPRSEYPRPQFARADWQCLNGPWDFALDQGRSGESRGLLEKDAPYPYTIQVPFCPESKLSGIEYKDFILGCWYRRTFQVEPERFDNSGRLASLLRLHFGAVDHEAEVFINGRKVGQHTGGYTSFEFEISPFVVPGDNTLIVFCKDDTRDPMIPRGKQSERYHSHGCDYTRTTGIWQSVWLEYLPKTHIESLRITPSLAAKSVVLQVFEDTLSVSVSFEGKEAAAVALPACGIVHEGPQENTAPPDGTPRPGTAVTLTLPLQEIHPWEVGQGGLYDVTLTFGHDQVTSYFGLRDIALTDRAVLINGKPVFQRLVLDQGFYPEGIYTAPSDEALLNDIQLSMAMGFNGARLHQKTFEERFLYHADRLGYLVWDEYGNWGLDHTDPMAIYSFLPTWLEEMQRDYNHPSLIGWCPFNETWDQNYRRQYDALLKLVYAASKAADPTRPVIDVSGAYHVVTDIYDYHDYIQDPKELEAHFPTQLDGTEKTAGWKLPGNASFLVPEDQVPLAAHFYDQLAPREAYTSGPAFVSEFGGIGFDKAAALSTSGHQDNEAWSYGNACHSEAEYIARFKGLCEALLKNPSLMGFCYTQLTDIEQEQNGVYTYDRQPKVDPAVFHEILSQKAAIEK